MAKNLKSSKDESVPTNPQSRPKKEKRKRKNPIVWEYEIVRADEPVDIEGLAGLLARMFLNSPFDPPHTQEKKIAPTKKKKPQGD